MTGGGGDGHGSSGYNGTLNGLQSDILYGGGIGHGFAQNRRSGFLDLQNLGIKFQGGTGDGFSGGGYIGSLDGKSLAVIYSGGIGQGFAQSRASPIILGDFYLPRADCVESYSDTFGNILVGEQSTSIQFEAIEVIHSIQVIKNSALNVTYDAGDQIELREGFEVELGAVFRIMLDGCGGR